uniref:Uncharacterized protein n=2 Tax=Cajanus cajan TaxID=3821 RepID=A0A151RNX7_CAJCA|nr:hypothetical protein KK1_034258 [Cajanus cajan]
MPLTVPPPPPSSSSSSSSSSYSGDGLVMQGGDTFELEYLDNKLLEELLQVQDNRHFYK